ncbi:MAG TPA: type II toxin-antitoxin system VapB family antitoxin [Streptosporangiaceae bacterium]|jgi:predicted transcriptional regulator|nr:type II toxin-antitoxin system VapB family antitoxin [Streptosporangiaceae bacterium]
MKTTVELPDELVREAQELARAEGTTMKSVLEEGLRAVIARHRHAQGFTLRDASVAGRGLRPDVAEAGWAKIRELSYGDRL